MEFMYANLIMRGIERHVFSAGFFNNKSLNRSDLDPIIEWLTENIPETWQIQVTDRILAPNHIANATANGNPHAVGVETNHIEVLFHYEDDAVAFKLRWM